MVYSPKSFPRSGINEHDRQNWLLSVHVYPKKLNLYYYLKRNFSVFQESVAGAGQPAPLLVFLFREFTFIARSSSYAFFSTAKAKRFSSWGGAIFKKVTHTAAIITLGISFRLGILIPDLRKLGSRRFVGRHFVTGIPVCKRIQD